MIAKITSGSNFRGVLDYLMQQKKEAEKQAKTFTQEELTKHEELQMPKQTREINKEAKEKTMDRGFDRIR